MGLDDSKASVAALNGSKPSLADRLKERIWPEEVKGLLLGDYDNAPYVKTGRVFTRALRLHQRISEPIPAGESGITSLCRGTNGKIYGATSGRQSHLFFYDPSPAGDGVADAAVLPGVKSVKRGLAVGSGGLIFAAASEMIEPEESGPLFAYDTATDYMDEFRVYTGKVEQVAVPVNGECIAAICSDPAGRFIYGLSSVTGTFFRFDVTSKTVELFGRVSQDREFSRFLIMDADGNVYGTHSLGTLFRFSADKQVVEDLGIRIPCIAGREFYNALDTAVYNPISGLIYGAGTADGLLFSMDPRTLEFRSLGKASAEPRVRAMTVSQDGRIFGIAGCEDGMGRPFCYDPARHELKELGIMFAASEVWRRGFEFDAACTGSSGELYFGENEREGHLFMYFPVPLEVRPHGYGMPF